MKKKLLDLIGGHFMDKPIDLVKNNHTLRGTADNWDLKVRVATRKSHQNKDYHLLASNLIANRICFDHLPNDKPIFDDIRKLPKQSFYMNFNEWKMYKKTTKILIGRIIVEFFPKFKFLKKLLPNHIEHKYSQQMNKKSTIINMPIIDANEASYADCVKVLETYEKWIAEIYNKAGKLDKVPKAGDEILINNQAETGQRYAHTLFTQNDPMKDMKIVFGGDMLTRVRFAGAKDLRKGAHTPSDRFEHCSPFKPVMWHCKASLLQYSYALLHSPESVQQEGTLKFFREALNRRNVTPKKVLDSYEGCEELFISIGKAYIVTAAMNFFKMNSLDENPKEHAFPVNFIHSSKEVKEKYLDDVLDKFVDKFVLQIGYSQGDYVQNYAYLFIFLTVLLLQMKDTAKEGDDDRNFINQKLLLTTFRSLGNYSKYSIEMFVSLAQQQCLLTPRLSEEFKWGFFVNWRGGPGHNMEEDLAQEISNCKGKEIVKSMGPNKTIKSISRVCKAVNGIKKISENFNENCSINNSSTQHSKPDEMNDEKEIISILTKLDPFNYVNGRHHASFPDIKSTPSRYINIVENDKWIEEHKELLYVPPQ